MCNEGGQREVTLNNGIGGFVQPAGEIGLNFFSEHRPLKVGEDGAHDLASMVNVTCRVQPFFQLSRPVSRSDGCKRVFPLVLEVAPLPHEMSHVGY